MATYRCKACEGLYVSPQGAMLYFHACPHIVDDAALGHSHLRPGHRDENLVQDLTVHEGVPLVLSKEGRIGTVTVRSRGPGRVRLSDQDLLTGADAARILELRALAGTDEPDP